MRKHFLCLLFFGGALGAYASESTSPAVAEVTQQGVTVTGVVKDEKGEPIIGATVIEKGTKNATVTDINGNYSLNVSNRNAILVVSYIGFTSQEVKAGSDVTLYAGTTTGWTDDYLWDNGQTANAVTVPSVTTSRTYTCQYANQSGAVSESRFHLYVVDALQHITV